MARQIEARDGLTQIMLSGGLLEIKVADTAIAIRVDVRSCVIAVDGISGQHTWSGNEWRIFDLRDGGIYGDFHRLKPPEDCFDPADCAGTGQHIA